MRSLSELYDNMSSPLDNPETIQKLIQAYANRGKGFGGYYGGLTKTVEKQNIGIKDADRDLFFSMIFNKWKNSIVGMTKERFEELKKRGSYSDDFKKLRQFLKNIPDVTTRQEAQQILYGQYDDKDLEGAMEKYSWTARGDGTSWIHVCSRDVTAKADKEQNVEHRLYLNTETIDTYEMTIQLVEKFDKHQLPYYFKFDETGNRDDTIVIYSDTENLTANIEILREIGEEYPELIQRAKEPPVLTGRVDNWIGYGSEPGRDSNGKRQSFNQVRAKLIEPIIDKETKEWVMTHKNQTIKYQDQDITFQDYITIKATQQMIKDLGRTYKYMSKNENEEDIARRKGYTVNDLKSASFNRKLYDAIHKNIELILSQVCNGEEMQPIDIDVRGGKKVQFKNSTIQETIESLATKIAANDNMFADKIKNDIINGAEQFGIDPTTFCFDISVREQIKSNNQKTNTKIQEASSLKQTDKTLKGKSVKSINSINITDFLNPTLMQQMIQLPSGASIPAKQYIQEVVAPCIPQNGKFILKNGMQVSAKQYIEEYILGEGQRKYNGDIKTLLSENTVSNSGKIIIGEEEINTIEIVNKLNPTLMQQKVSLPNGVKIPAKQYIQEWVAPHIPQNGKFILKNGEEISAMQYIEEFVMFKGQEDFNGDITELLFNTTKANNGTIEFDDEKIVGQKLKKEIGISPAEAKKREEEKNNIQRRQDEEEQRQKSEEQTKKNNEQFTKQKKLSGESVKRDIIDSKVNTSEINQVQDEIALRNERGILASKKFRHELDEEGQKRLEQIDSMLGIKRIQFNQTQKRGHGQSR